MLTQKDEHHYWIFHIRISLSTNFQLKPTIKIFWTKFAKKGSYFQFKTYKKNTTTEFCIFELVFVSNFTVKKQLNFWTKFTLERYLCLKTIKVNIIIEFRLFKLVLVPNFSSKWQFCFWDQICTKRYFWSKTEKVNIIIEFRIFKLVSWNQISALTDNFDFFDQIYPKRVFLV